MAEALAAAFTDNLLTCSICLEEYEDPRVLPCYHTFCYGCISDHATRTVTKDSKFLCPICRDEIRSPKKGLDQLKKNFTFRKAKDIITQQQAERRKSENEQSIVAATTKVNAQLTIGCETHPGNELKYYCEDDDTVVCGDCALTDHYRHGILPVEKVAKSNRETIETALVKSLAKVNIFKEAVAKEGANEFEDSLFRKGTVNSIERQAQQICTLINERKETLISEVNSAYDVRKAKSEANKDILELHHASLHSACDFAQQLVTYGTDSDIMVHAKTLTERLVSMENTPVLTPDTTAEIYYSPGEISTTGLEAMLGQVTVQSKPPLTGLRTNPSSAPNLPVFLAKAECVHSFSTELKDDTSKTFITGLATDEQFMYAVDWRNDRTKIFSYAGEFKFDIKLNKPFDIAVSQTGKLYITSKGDKCIKVYSITGQQMTTMGHRQLEMPCGITLNRQGHVMVCDSKKKSIFAFHVGSGQLLNSIPLNMCTTPQYITVNTVNDNIVISDLGKHGIHVLSSTGDQLYQYGTQGSGDGQLHAPWGMCTDSFGHIFIVDCYNKRIVTLSPQGQFIRNIATKDDGLEGPTTLTINPAGLLVVTEAQGKVKTFLTSPYNRYCTLTAI